MDGHENPGFIGTAVYIVLAMALVLLNGFFVLVEFALVKIRRTRLEELVEAGSVRARLALTMHRHMDEYLSATQLGITVASLGLGWIGEPAFAHVFHGLFELPALWSKALSASAALVVAFCLITFLHILVGELAPKSLAIQQAERAILWSAPLMRVFYLIFYVPLIILTKASNGLLRLIGFKPTRDVETAVSEEELRHVLAHSHKRGGFSLDLLLLFENALDFSGMTTGEIMRPLSEVDVLDADSPWEKNMGLLRETKHSRYPVVKGDPNNVVGMVHVKELGLDALELGPEPDLADFKREVFVVRDNLPLEGLLRAFQRRRQHLALVRNSSGDNVGIVTLEDLLEELVGEILDEFDVGPESPLALAEFINEKRITLNLAAENAQDAIRQMLALVAGDTGINAETAFAAVWKRENSAPTGLGRRLAVPHARLREIREPCVAFARCPAGVDFRASDGAAATLLFLILTPESAPLLQVKMLARIAGIMESGYLTTRLQESTSPKEVMEVIRAADVAATL